MSAAKQPSSRRAARETALRVLYTIDVGKQPVDEVIGETAEAHDLDEKARAFMEALVRGALRNRQEVDAEIDRLATGFPTERQTAVDRNILRLAAAEILYQVSDAPPGAVVNEAVELAKKYSTGESGRFVNGVLGSLVREVETRRGGSVSSESDDASPADTTEDIETATEPQPGE